MNRRSYNGRRKKGFAFSVSENQNRKDFVNYLLETKEIPPDASVSAEIVKIKKHYQIISKCEGPYIAHWKVKCFWEHKEEYTYTDTEIVFVDKYGIEHSYQDKGWTAVPKTITKTDYKTVVDDIRLIERDIENNYCELIPAQGIIFPLDNWIIERFSKSEIPVTLLNDSDFSECVVKEKRNKEIVLTLAKTNCKDACLAHVKGIIPGSRHTDFTFDFKSDFEISEEYFIPIYQVVYTYNHHQYEVWFSGYEKGIWFSDKAPKNSRIKSPEKRNCKTNSYR